MHDSLLDTFAIREKFPTIVILECFYRVSIPLSIRGFPLKALGYDSEDSVFRKVSSREMHDMLYTHV